MSPKRTRNETKRKSNESKTEPMTKGNSSDSPTLKQKAALAQDLSGLDADPQELQNILMAADRYRPASPTTTMSQASEVSVGDTFAEFVNKQMKLAGVGRYANLGVEGILTNRLEIQKKKILHLAETIAVTQKRIDGINLWKKERQTANLNGVDLSLQRNLAAEMDGLYERFNRLHNNCLLRSYVRRCRWKAHFRRLRDRVESTLKILDAEQQGVPLRKTSLLYQSETGHFVKMLEQLQTDKCASVSYANEIFGVIFDACKSMELILKEWNQKTHDWVETAKGFRDRYKELYKENIDLAVEQDDKSNSLEQAKQRQAYLQSVLTRLTKKVNTKTEDCEAHQALLNNLATKLGKKTRSTMVESVLPPRMQRRQSLMDRIPEQKYQREDHAEPKFHNQVYQLESPDSWQRVTRTNKILSVYGYKGGKGMKVPRQALVIVSPRSSLRGSKEGGASPTNHTTTQPHNHTTNHFTFQKPPLPTPPSKPQTTRPRPQAKPKQPQRPQRPQRPHTSRPTTRTSATHSAAHPYTHPALQMPTPPPLPALNPLHPAFEQVNNLPRTLEEDYKVTIPLFR